MLNVHNIALPKFQHKGGGGAIAPYAHPDSAVGHS